MAREVAAPQGFGLWREVGALSKEPRVPLDAAGTQSVNCSVDAGRGCAHS